MARLRAPRSLTNAKPCAYWKLQTAIIYPWKFGAAVDARVVNVVPEATDAVVTAAGALEPKKFSVQGPCCAAVPNGSVDVFEIANPVSNPAMFVTNGNNRLVRHIVTDTMLAAVDVSINRGIGPELATAPAAAVKAVGGVGA